MSEWERARPRVSRVYLSAYISLYQLWVFALKLRVFALGLNALAPQETRRASQSPSQNYRLGHGQAFLGHGQAFPSPSRTRTAASWRGVTRCLVPWLPWCWCDKCAKHRQLKKWVPLWNWCVSVSVVVCSCNGDTVDTQLRVV